MRLLTIKYLDKLPGFAGIIRALLGQAKGILLSPRGLRDVYNQGMEARALLLQRLAFRGRLPLNL